jgi:hypothetical protein
MRGVAIWTPPEENYAPIWTPYPSGVPIWTPPDVSKVLSYPEIEQDFNPTTNMGEWSFHPSAPPDITGTPTAGIILKKLRAKQRQFMEKYEGEKP